MLPGFTAAISDGIHPAPASSAARVHDSITLRKDRTLERLIIAQRGTVHFVGVGPNVEGSNRRRRAPGCRLCHRPNGLGREEAYMLLSVIGE